MEGDAVVVGLADGEHARPSDCASPRAALRAPRRDRHRLHDLVSVDDARCISRSRATSSSGCAAALRTARSRTSSLSTPTARRSALVPMVDPKMAVDEPRLRRARARLQDRGVRRPRAPRDRHRRRVPARHVRRRQRVRLRPGVGQVRRARRRARVPQLAARAPGDAIGHELRVQPRGRSGREPRVALQVAVSFRGHAPLSHAAFRLPRRRCRCGCSLLGDPRWALGEAQRERDPRAGPRRARRRRLARAVRAVRRRPRHAGIDELRAYFRAVPARAWSSSTSSPPRHSSQCKICAIASYRTSTSGARPTIDSSRGPSPKTSTRPARASGRSSAPTSRTGTCPT